MKKVLSYSIGYFISSLQLLIQPNCGDCRNLVSEIIPSLTFVSLKIIFANCGYYQLRLLWSLHYSAIIRIEINIYADMTATNCLKRSSFHQKTENIQPLLILLFLMSYATIFRLFGSGFSNDFII